jgi:hypothetical protein
MILFNQTVSPGSSGFNSYKFADTPIACNITAVNNSSVSATITVYPSGYSYPVGSDTAPTFAAELSNFTVAGNGASLLIVVDSVGKFDPNQVGITSTLSTSISGTVTTDIGAANAYSKAAQLPSALDGSGNFKTRALVGTDNPDISVNQTNPLKTAPAATAVTGGIVAPTAVGEMTVESILGTGTSSLALGQTVYFSIACSAVVEVAAATESIQYIAIKGATTGLYYALAYAGEAVSGSFPVYNAEKLNIVALNSSTATGCNVTGYWQAMSP